MTPKIDTRKLCAVMFTDIAGYTQMTQTSEEDAVQKIALHREYLETFTSAYNGNVIHYYGDGSLSIYDSVIDAVRCAIQMQWAYMTKGHLPVRIGIHLGDVVFRDGSVFGDGVNIASRIQAEGIPGSILVSDKVASELQNHDDISLQRTGRYSLKNISEPIELFAIANQGLKLPRRKGMRFPRSLDSRLRYGIPVAALLLAIIFIRMMSSATPRQEILNHSERIAIPQFEDLTNLPENSMISKMAAHWITTELIETGQASVVSYKSAVENAGNYKHNGEREQLGWTGAVNVIQGAYYLCGSKKDSLEFRATILHLPTGRLLNIPLARPRCASDNPMDCIRELSGSIRGYWNSKADLPLQTPNYEAYKLYIQARDVWFENDSLVKELLNQAIEADPGFIDAYFMLLDWHYDNRDPESVAEMIKEVEDLFPQMTERQQNYLAFYEADNRGDYTDAWSHFKREYQNDPRDLFINTSAMVLASEYLNDPKLVIDFFKQIPNDSLDLNSCRYCEERWAFAVYAYHALGKNRKALKLAAELEKHVERFQNFDRLVQFYTAIGDTSAVASVIARSTRFLPDRHTRYLFFVAAKQAKLKGNTELRDYYALQAEKRSEKSYWMTARCRYLLDDLESAAALYENVFKKDSSNSRLAGELGLTYARLNKSEKARTLIKHLGKIKESFDFGETPYRQAKIELCLGNEDLALSLLRQSLEEGILFLGSLTFDQDPDLIPLFENPAFISMCRR